MKPIKIFQLGLVLTILASSQVLLAQNHNLGDFYAEVSKELPAKKNTVYNVDTGYHGPTDRVAYFPGGQKILQQFIQNTMQYPTIAQENAVEGTVIVGIRIDANGNIESAKILESPGFNLDKEALRIVDQMPKWEPALSNGKKSASTVNIAIVFRLR